jgi:hypothetical protein
MGNNSQTFLMTKHRLKLASVDIYQHLNTWNTIMLDPKRRHSNWLKLILYAFS